MVLQVGRKEEASGGNGFNNSDSMRGGEVLYLHIPVSLDWKWQSSSKSMKSSQPTLLLVHLCWNNEAGIICWHKVFYLLLL